MRTATAPAATPSTLTASELAAADQDGFHIVRGLLAAAEVTELLDAFMAVAAGGPIRGLSDVPPATAADDPLARYPRMMHPHEATGQPRIDALATRWLLDRRIEGVLRDLMREQPVAAQSMFYFKPAGARGQAFHQDNYYLQVRPTTCWAAWISLDRADAETGGLMVAKGSHRLPDQVPVQADLSRSMAHEFVAIPAGMEVAAPVLEPGDVLFFNGQLIHGSNPNTSKDRFRRSLICHYLPQSSTAIAEGYHHALRRFDGSRAVYAGTGARIVAPH